MPIYPFYPDLTGPSDPRAAAVVFIVVLVIACAAAGVALWRHHREKDQHRPRHQH